MPAITVSILSIVKGALILAKSHAVTTAVAKYAPYLIHKFTVETLIGTGVTVCAATGVVATIASMPKNLKNGCTDMVEGLTNQDPAKFLRGVGKLGTVYHTAADVIDTFDSFVDQSNIRPEIRISLEKTVKDLSSVIQHEIEGKTIELLESAQNKLKSKGTDIDGYAKTIQAIYVKHTMDLESNCSLCELLGRCGRIYSDLSDLNYKCGLIESKNKYDHYLAYCISGWILDNKKYTCLPGYSQKSLAGEITNQILAYLHANKLG